MLQRFLLIFSFLAVLVGVLGVAVRAQEHGENATVRIQSLELDNADIRLVLKTIFQKARGSYTIDPDVQGKVTMRIHDAPLNTVLDHVMRQVDAGYAIDGAGVYHFMPRRSQVAPSKAEAGGGAVAISADDQYLYVVRGSQILKLSKGSLTAVQSARLPDPR
ncbi:MAG TPA: hypothetical protein VM328_09390 [Fimbriimonadaceae bacterium]|nr:hypothetical protein [Fimbriimonadaceae bacterium]